MPDDFSHGFIPGYKPVRDEAHVRDHQPLLAAMIRALSVFVIAGWFAGCGGEPRNDWPGVEAVKTVYADNADHYQSLAEWLRRSGHAYVYPSRRGTGVYVATSDTPGTMRMFARGEEEAALDQVLLSLGVSKASIGDDSVALDISPVVDREISYARSLLWKSTTPNAKACAQVSRSSANGECALPLAQSWWLIYKW